MSAGTIDPHLVSLLQPRSFEAEQYRVLRHLVEQQHRDGALAVVAVTSADVGDGKTTTAINLAGALSQGTESRVLLIDADLRRGSLGMQLRVHASDGGGLVDAILNAERDLDEVLLTLTDFNLAVLPVGRCPAAPYEMLKSPRLGELIQTARKRYDYVVVDTPPLVPVPDTRVIEKWVDGFVFVVAAHRTPRSLLEEALNIITPDKLVGLVFNGAKRPSRGRYGYYAYYAPPANGHGAGLWSRTAGRAWRSLWPHRESTRR